MTLDDEYDVFRATLTANLKDGIGWGIPGVVPSIGPEDLRACQDALEKRFVGQMAVFSGNPSWQPATWDSDANRIFITDADRIRRFKQDGMVTFSVDREERPGVLRD